MTVLERQHACLKWQQEQSQKQQQKYHQQQQEQLQKQQQQYQQQQQESYFSELSGVFSMPSELMNQMLQQPQHGFEGGLMGSGDSMSLAGSAKLNPAMENGWPNLGKIMVPNSGFGHCGPGSDASYAISRTSSCPPAVVPDAVALKAKESVVLNEKTSAVAGRESLQKRKADKVQSTKAAAQEDSKDKRMKGSAEEGESKITEQNNNNNKSNSNNNRETSADTSKENSKASEVQKPDYIHVRARRGQATDSHSLAERVRREKISERMKYLQDLVPGCNKITGKAGMLDEIINYVQSLQRQVEFLSMKLAAVNPRLNFNIDNFFATEAFHACPSNFPTFGTSSEITNPVNLPFHPQLQQQLVSCSGLEMGINPSDIGLRRTISAPISIPELFLDSSFFPQLQPSSNWDADLQHYYNVSFDQGRSTTPFPSQPFTGSIEASNLKMEM